MGRKRVTLLKCFFFSPDGGEFCIKENLEREENCNKAESYREFDIRVGFSTCFTIVYLELFSLKRIHVSLTSVLFKIPNLEAGPAMGMTLILGWVER